LFYIKKKKKKKKKRRENETKKAKTKPGLITYCVFWGVGVKGRRDDAVVWAAVGGSVDGLREPWVGRPEVICHRLQTLL